MQRHDVIIVGGRVAGAATALLLARAGLDVLVLEREDRGSDTLSTHALMRAGILQLRRWGLLDEVVAAGTPPQDRVVFHYGEDRLEIDLAGSLYAPRRTVLDPLLVTAAERAGARFRFGVSVQDLVREHGRVTGVRAARRGASPATVSARIVIGADGRNSRVAREVDAVVTNRGDGASAALFGYFSGVPTAGYEWGFAPGTMAGLIPTNDGQVCVYAGAPPRRFMDELRRDLAGGLERVVKETNPDIADRVAAGSRHGPVRGFPGLQGIVRRPWGPGWALVGDAGYFKDPSTAHGISDALRDAELLARDVHAELFGATADAGTYERVRDRLARPFFAVTDAIAAFDWDLDRLRGLHLEMSRAMQPEVDHLAGLEPWAGVPETLPGVAVGAAGASD